MMKAQPTMIETDPSTTRRKSKWRAIAFGCSAAIKDVAPLQYRTRQRRSGGSWTGADILRQEWRQNKGNETETYPGG